MTDASTAAYTELTECVDAVYSKPEYASIKKHYITKETNHQITVEQLANNTKPKASETKLIIDLDKDKSVCRGVFLKKMENISSEIANIYYETINKASNITLQLAQRKITWGVASQKTQELLLDTQKKLSETDRQINRELNASYQFEVQERQRNESAAMMGFLGALQNTAQRNQAPVYIPPSPQKTECSTYYGKTTCYTDR